MADRSRRELGDTGLAHLLERLKTDANLARDVAASEGLLDVRALLDGLRSSLRAASAKLTAHETAKIAPTYDRARPCREMDDF